MRDHIHPTAARIGPAIERTVMLEQHAVTISHRMNVMARRKPTTAELIRANAARETLFLRCFAARARRPQTILHRMNAIARRMYPIIEQIHATHAQASAL